MPFFRAGSGVYYFAHVPKCAGTSVEDYLRARFGRLAFLDDQFNSRTDLERWTRTSPQHADWAALKRLFGRDFFDGAFAVVRHPVARAVSVYHFQVEVEKNTDISFADWLSDMQERHTRDPFLIDNHFRPQVDFLPDECTLFHLEHGLDGIVPYLDQLTGDHNGPRGIGHTNMRDTRQGISRISRAKVGPDEIAILAEIYAIDFRRLGYRPDSFEPIFAPPCLDPDVIAEAVAARAQAGQPLSRLLRRVQKKVRRWVDA